MAHRRLGSAGYRPHRHQQGPLTVGASGFEGIPRQLSTRPATADPVRGILLSG